MDRIHKVVRAFRLFYNAISFRKFDTTHRDVPEINHMSAFILICSAIENTESNMAILSRLLQAIANPPA